jgi:magnesium transporter
MFFRIGNHLEELTDEAEGGLIAEIREPEEAERVPLRFCKAESDTDRICGTIRVAVKGSEGKQKGFSYELSPQKVLFLDESGYAEAILRRMQEEKTFAEPGIGLFFCSFLEEMIRRDLLYLADMEDRIARLEDAVLSGNLDNFNHKVMACRKEILSLSHYYVQLAELGAVFQEDENSIFRPDEKRHFRLFTERVSRLKEEVQRLREYSTQVREVYQAQIDIRQNKIMKILTVVTTIFLPLSLIAGWYGMNFVHMPELTWKYGYLAVILVSAAVVIFCIWIFKKKKFW